MLGPQHLIQTLWKSSINASPKISLIMLDWSVRESFHLFDALAKQNVPRDCFEVILIEYYDREAPDVRRRVDEALACGHQPPVDQWLALRIPREIYYHKHLMYNVGFVAAHAPLVCIIDSDAIVTEHFVARILRHFDEYPETVLHIDQVRNTDKQYYPYNHPTIGQILGPGCINWDAKKKMTVGMSAPGHPILNRNYGACMAARREDVIAVGGADEADEYLGHVCGPYDLTFRLVNAGKKEVWLEDEFIYHTWHPGSDGVDNYSGPHEGHNVSVLAIEAIQTGRVLPRLENPLVSALRHGGISKSVPQDELPRAISSKRVDGWAYDDFKRHLGMARMAMIQENWQEALDEFHAAGVSPESPYLLTEIGWCCQYLNRFQEAADYFERAVALSPSYYRIYCGLGWALLQCGRFMEAIGAFEQAQAKLPPKFSDHQIEIWRGLACTWLKLRDTRNAREVCNKIEANASDARIKHELEQLSNGIKCLDLRYSPPGTRLPLSQYLLINLIRSRNIAIRAIKLFLRGNLREYAFAGLKYYDRYITPRQRLSSRLAFARKALAACATGTFLRRLKGWLYNKTVRAAPSNQAKNRAEEPQTYEGHQYFLKIPEIHFCNNLDFLLLELPPRYQPMLPNGLGYLDSILAESGIDYQLVDTSIIYYHRYHAERLSPGGEKMTFPPGLSRNDDPWDNTLIHRWHEDEFSEYFWNFIHDTVEKIIRAQPKMIGLSLSGGNRALAAKLIDRIRHELPMTKIIVGGYDCVYHKSGKYLCKDYDYMFIKEVELTLVPVLRALLRGETPRNRAGVISKYDTPDREWQEPPLLQNLDACKWPHYEWADLTLYQTFRREHLIPIAASRGCAWGHCSFCAECFQYRGRSPSSVVDEIEFFVRKGFHTFHFNESDVNGNPDTLYEICSIIIQRGLNVQLVGQLRIHPRSTAEYFQHLARAGFAHLRFGVDGWSKNTLKLQHKGYTLETAKQNILDCHAAGITTCVNIVFGIPGETEEDIDEMIKNLSELKDDIDEVQGINSLILATGSDYFINSEKHGVCFRGDKNDIFHKYPHYIPVELWYSVEPYIDQEVRLRRLERLCAAIHNNGVNIGPFASMVIKNLKGIGADPSIKASSTLKEEDKVVFDANK